MTAPLLRALRRLRWYVREFTDESAYERYVAHLRKEHPHTAAPDRRAFERMRTERRESDPRQGFRCC